MSEATTTTSADVHHIDDLDIRALVTWGLVSVIVTIVTIFGLYALYNDYADEQRVIKSYDVPYREATSQKNEQLGLLVEPIRYLDQQGNTLAVPIGIAERITIEEFSGD